jgi:peptidoglycan-associated lipoprotein
MKKLALVGMPLVLLALACGGDKPPPKAAEPQPVAEKEPPRTTSAPQNKQMAVNVDDEITKKCNLKVAAMPEESAKFDFDSDEVTPAEKQILEQVAKCLTTGPLKGRSVDLVGRADPRGEHEYNMSLGGRRARSVNNFLGQLGVPSDKMHDTSRGALDATGTDEAGWRLDRRVDVKLRP